MSGDVRPATWGDVVALMPRMAAGVAIGIRSQMDAGPSYALELDGRAVIVAGLIPIAGGGAGAWFLPGPGAAAAMLAMVRAARLTLRAAPYRPVIVQVQSEAGRRIALAIGFEPAGRHGDKEVLTYERDVRRRRQKASGTTAANGDRADGAPDRAS